ncbi:hypothetical protein ACFQ0G_10785 [Streptomyces chiangmaiensis]
MELVVIHDGRVITVGDLLSDDNLPGMRNILNAVCSHRGPRAAHTPIRAANGSRDSMPQRHRGPEALRLLMETGPDKGTQRCVANTERQRESGTQ